jgi:cytochrome P450
VVIGVQMGANPDDIWRIKAWTDAWVQRLGLMQTPDQVIWSTEMEIEAQHYFQPIFERLRREPDDSLLSDLVNTPIPEWGRCLTDEELHAEMMADTFVGGSETTTNAISGGVRLLIEHPEQWARLKRDPEHYLPILVEEVLRLESPVQRLMRTTAVDVEMHGVTIPAGSLVLVGYSAANRDDRQFEAPAAFDLDRAHALYRKILGPVAPMLAGKQHLVVVPTGALTSLPMQVLVNDNRAAPLPGTSLGEARANLQGVVAELALKALGAGCCGRNKSAKLRP